VNVQSIADITGSGVAVALSATSLRAKWINFTVAGSPLVTTCRAGDKNVSATRGAIIPINVSGSVNGLPLLFPNGQDPFDVYDLAAVFVFLPSSAYVLSVTFGGVA